MQFVFNFPAMPRYSFSNFVVCSGNSTAFQFARKILNPEESDKLLYLHGPCGSGKTHLLQAIAASLGEKQPVVSFKHFDKIHLSNAFIEAPALLLDDIEQLPDDNNLKVELWQLFNDFYAAGKIIAIAAALPPREVINIDDHLTSRLLWGLVAKTDISDDDSRRMIMKKLAEDRKIILPADVIDYMLIHVQRDIPSLAETLENIQRYAMTTQRKITVRLARELLGLLPETA